MEQKKEKGLSVRSRMNKLYSALYMAIDALEEQHDKSIRPGVLKILKDLAEELKPYRGKKGGLAV